MGYWGRALRVASRRAFDRYRFYIYWRRQEKKARARSPAEAQEAQWRKLIRILEFAYRQIPLYQDKFAQAGITPADIRSREDLLKLPLLTKAEIRQSFPDRILNGQRTYSASHMGQTSGSTAESLHFVRPQRTWHRSLYYSILLRMGGIRNIPILVLATPHCTAATCSFEEREQDLAGVWISKFHKIPLLRHLDGLIGLPSSEDVLGAPAEYMERLLDILNIYAPCLLIVDPVYLAALARYVKANGLSAPRVAVILTTYELLTSSVEDLLRDVFQCDVYTEYGSSEVADIANECEHHALHVRSENVLVEAVRDGRHAQPGELARCVLTDLENYNMPFIRYDIGDVIALGDGECPCGRKTETIDTVHGRVHDLVEVESEHGNRLLTPLDIDGIFHGLPGVAWYRFVQEGPSRHRIDIVPDRAGSTLDQDELLRRCRSLLGDRAEVEVGLVDEIKPQASMKYRFVYSESWTPDL